MAFYIKPPKRGSISLSKLTAYSKKRLNFLLDVYACHGKPLFMQDLVEQLATVSDSDCLIEGSTKDQLSHFMLRLASSSSPEMTSFFVQAEVMLFSFRASCFTEDELVRCCRPLCKFMTEASGCKLSPAQSDIYHLLSALLKPQSCRELVENYCRGKAAFVDIPFHLVPNMVAKREVTLHQGMAHVPIKRLCDLLTITFQAFLTEGMELARKRLAHALEDERIKNLILECRSLYRRRYPTMEAEVRGNLRADEVHPASVLFPPCMQHLHQVLQEKHRLQHYARVQYSLFLKEIGLPVNEALAFWRQEYSLPSRNSTCQHSWASDAKRYTYNIRHLYGLEGSRTNYRGHCCSSIQNNLIVGEEGSCPFKSFDTDQLKSILELNSIPVTAVTRILSQAANGFYGAACMQYLHCMLEIQHGISFVNTIRGNGGIDPTSSDRVMDKFSPTCTSTVPVDSKRMKRDESGHLERSEEKSFHSLEYFQSLKGSKNESKVSENCMNATACKPSACENNPAGDDSRDKHKPTEQPGGQGCMCFTLYNTKEEVQFFSPFNRPSNCKCKVTEKMSPLDRTSDHLCPTPLSKGVLNCDKEQKNLEFFSNLKSISHPKYFYQTYRKLIENLKGDQEITRK